MAGNLLPFEAKPPVPLVDQLLQPGHGAGVLQNHCWPGGGSRGQCRSHRHPRLSGDCRVAGLGASAG